MSQADHVQEVEWRWNGGGMEVEWRWNGDGTKAKEGGSYGEVRAEVRVRLGD